MSLDEKLVDQIEALPRDDFRASVNPIRRATLAIGVLVFHWGQFDSSLGTQLEFMRSHHSELGLGGFPDRHPNSQSEKMTLLRSLIQACDHEPARLREFDRLRGRVVAATAIRDDLVHGALGLGNSTGTAEGVYLLCAPYRKAKKTENGTEASRVELKFHKLSEIFKIADQLWNDREALEKLVRAVMASNPRPHQAGDVDTGHAT